MRKIIRDHEGQLGNAIPLPLLAECALCNRTLGSDDTLRAGDDGHLCVHLTQRSLHHGAELFQRVPGQNQHVECVAHLRSRLKRTALYTASALALASTNIHAPPVPCKEAGIPCCLAIAPSSATVRPEPRATAKRTALREQRVGRSVLFAPYQAERTLGQAGREQRRP